jgi:murein DD-endopeptidase MepM/ murein hydrolase activator NlpD
MGERFFTFLYFPGTHGKLRKVRMPYYVVELFTAFSLIGMITVVALAGSYTRMLLKVWDFNNIRSESESLKVQNRTLQNVVSDSTAKLNSLQSLAAEVALTYGLGGNRRPRVPSAVLVMATGHHFSPQAGFDASLNALNLLKTTRLLSPRVPILQSSLLDPLNDDTVTPSIWPVRGQITAGFGQRMDPFTGEGAFHSGIDIAAPAGTKIEAAADGILFLAGPDSGYGTEVLIDHGYGITTKYGHLSATYAVVGQEVKRGQIIGAVGMTGRSTGPHLHYEVRIYETAVNPAKYLPGLHRPPGEPFQYDRTSRKRNQTEAQGWNSPSSPPVVGSTGGQ